MTMWASVLTQQMPFGHKVIFIEFITPKASLIQIDLMCNLCCKVGTSNLELFRTFCRSGWEFLKDSDLAEDLKRDKDDINVCYREKKTTHICETAQLCYNHPSESEIVFWASGDGFSRTISSLNLDHTVRQCGPGLILEEYSAVWFRELRFSVY